jgi:hypothetical protein
MSTTNPTGWGTRRRNNGAVDLRAPPASPRGAPRRAKSDTSGIHAGIFVERSQVFHATHNVPLWWWMLHTHLKKIPGFSRTVRKGSGKSDLFSPARSHLRTGQYRLP